MALSLIPCCLVLRKTSLCGETHETLAVAPMSSQERGHQNNAIVNPSSSDVGTAVVGSTNARPRPPPIPRFVAPSASIPATQNLTYDFIFRSSFFNGTSSPVIDHGQFIGHQEIHLVFNNSSREISLFVRLRCQNTKYLHLDITSISIRRNGTFFRRKTATSMFRNLLGWRLKPDHNTGQRQPRNKLQSKRTAHK